MSHQKMTREESDFCIARQALISKQIGERREMEQRHAAEKLELQSRHHDEQRKCADAHPAVEGYGAPFSTVWS